MSKTPSTGGVVRPSPSMKDHGPTEPEVRRWLRAIGCTVHPTAGVFEWHKAAMHVAAFNGDFDQVLNSRGQTVDVSVPEEERWEWRFIVKRLAEDATLRDALAAAYRMDGSNGADQFLAPMLDEAMDAWDALLKEQHLHRAALVAASRRPQRMSRLRRAVAFTGGLLFELESKEDVEALLAAAGHKSKRSGT